MELTGEILKIIKDLAAEKKIFGRDFAYIRDIGNFSKIVGRYLTKQLETDN